MIALLVAVVLQCSTTSYLSKSYSINDFNKLNKAMRLLKTFRDLNFVDNFKSSTKITVGQNSILI